MRAAAWAAALAAASAAQYKNVLFFVADDLRPQLNAAYGHPYMQTPRIDAFTRQSLVFDWAYCNFAICSPSRNSFMTGRAPDRTRVWNFMQDFRHAGVDLAGAPGANWTSLPEYFKAHGYTTLGHGKLYHPGKPADWDEPLSWSQDRPYGPEVITGCKTGNYCPQDKPAAEFSDYNTTLEAIASLQYSVALGKPFFL